MKDATITLIKETAKPATKPVSQPVKTNGVDDLKTQFDVARAAEDWKTVSRLAREISQAERALIESRKEALQKQGLLVQSYFENAIKTAIQEVCDNLSVEELRLVEGIWLTKDFGNGDYNVKIVKDRMPKTRTKKTA